MRSAKYCATCLALCFTSMPTTLLAQDSIPWPQPIMIFGALDDIPIDTKGITLMMKPTEISELLGGRIILGSWYFRNAKGVEPAGLTRQDPDNVGGRERSGASVDSITAHLSQWHTGSRPLRIIRSVTLDDSERTSEQNFVSAIRKKYGETLRQPSSVRSMLGLPGSATIYQWTFNNGVQSADCEVVDIPYNIDEAYTYGSIDIPLLRLAGMDTGDICGGELMVAYSLDGAGRVESYQVRIQDARALTLDNLNDFSVQEEMRAAYLEAAQNNSSNTPDL